MFRMNGMARSHGCERAPMFRPFSDILSYKALGHLGNCSCITLMTNTPVGTCTSMNGQLFCSRQKLSTYIPVGNGAITWPFIAISVIVPGITLITYIHIRTWLHGIKASLLVDVKERRCLN
jgi:hypothetical protein